MARHPQTTKGALAGVVGGLGMTGQNSLAWFDNYDQATANFDFSGRLTRGATSFAQSSSE